jgi:NAD(P)-dependent dehydrogenase (short-subunit alcohol dehydrogenase family)
MLYLLAIVFDKKHWYKERLSMLFVGKNIVVTGGASGIGCATAQAFAREGGAVAVLDRVMPEFDCHFLECDVSSEQDVRHAVDEAAHVFSQRIDVLFNNAGVAIRNPVAKETIEGWDRCFEVNVRGVYLCSRFVLPYMTAGASIIHSASVTGIMGVRNRGAYSATKGAIVALTRNMALDYAARGIRVNCVCPGFVRTPLLASVLADTARAGLLTRLHPLGRLGEPADIANAVLFLASEAASWITGQTLAIDGGFSVGHAQDI